MLLDTIQVFYGEATPTHARIYAQVDRPNGGAAWRLTGRMVGPRNALAATLPATIEMRDLGAGPTLLAGAVLPDPCFWSSESPALYDVEATLWDEQGRRRESIRRELGIRALGPRGSSFYLEGRRHVLRAVDRLCDGLAPVAAWREAWASMLVRSPNEALCREASEQGVPIAAWVTGTRRKIECELRRLSPWAAVAMAVLDCAEPLDETIAAAAPNIVLGQFAGCEDAEHGKMPTAAAWAKFLVGEVDRPEVFARRFASIKLPVVALGQFDGAHDVTSARAGCDSLQRDLAPFGDYAGYMITS